MTKAWAEPEPWIAHSFLFTTILSQTLRPRANYHSSLHFPWLLPTPSQLHSCMLFNVPHWPWGYRSFGTPAFALTESSALLIFNLQTPPHHVPEPMRTKPLRCSPQSRVWNLSPLLSWYAREPETSSPSSSLMPTLTPIPRPWILVLLESFPAYSGTFCETQLVRSWRHHFSSPGYKHLFTQGLSPATLNSKRSLFNSLHGHCPLQ